MLSGWGRYPIASCDVLMPDDSSRAAAIVAAETDLIARGNGRSYGDASLNPHATIDMLRADRLIAFDGESGRLVCEAGLLLAEVIDVLLPRGWFPAVTPGTKWVTIGGMIAGDVHGKNHHGAGSFGDHVDWLDLAVGSGEVLRCSRQDHPDLFAATCGGLGLTGVIVRACFRLQRVETASVRQRVLRAPTLAHALDRLEHSLDWTYSVAWIDCLASGSHLGRSLVFLGEHALPDELPPSRRTAPLERAARKRRVVPIDFPSIALSRGVVRLFNRCYYVAHRPGEAIVDIDPYFYPLDALRDWNRIYGKRGFVQFQCVLPTGESAKGLARLLTEIAGGGDASFLAVLKRMGRESFGLLSFPREGYTLALDFPATPANLALLDRLDRIVAEHGGRLYLVKDARTTAASVAGGYPRLAEFRAVRHRHGLDARFSSLLSRRLEI